MNRLHSILFMGSSFGASRWWLLGTTSRSVAAFTPTMLRIPQRTIHQSMFLASANDKVNENENENNVVKPTWEYVPYDPKKPKRKSTTTNNNRNSVWKVPKTVNIPEDKLDISFVRSSGSGGQNVNKLSTKVELRLDLSMRQLWIPVEVQRRLKEQQSNRISKEGLLSITSQEHRTQGMNRKSALDKLQKMVLEAWPRPKIRKQRTGISKAAKARNKDFKKRQSEKKTNRRKVDW